MILLFLLLSLAPARPTKSFPTLFVDGVTSKNIDQYFQEGINDWFLIEFYASWCPHCQHFAPEMERLAQALNSPGTPMRIGIIDCAAEMALCTFYNIEAYPKLVIGSRKAWQDSRTPHHAVDERSVGLAPDGKSIVLKIEYANLTPATSTSLPGHVFLLEAKQDVDKLADWLNKFCESDYQIESADQFRPTYQQLLRTEWNRLYGSVAVETTTYTHANDLDIKIATAYGLQSAFRRLPKLVNVMKDKPIDGSSAATPTPFQNSRATSTLLKYLNLLCHFYPNDTCRNSLCSLTERVRASFDDFLTNSSGNSQLFAPLRQAEFRKVEFCDGTMGDYINREWTQCLGTYNKRGYPCGLWLIIHSLVAAMKNIGEFDNEKRRLPPRYAKIFRKSRSPSPNLPLDEEISYENNLKTIRLFIGHYFECWDCRDHFLEISSGAESVHSHKDAVIWFWQIHNKVNERVFGLEQEYQDGDPLFPKNWFPSAVACPECRFTPSASFLELSNEVSGQALEPADSKQPATSQNIIDPFKTAPVWKQDAVYNFLQRWYEFS